MLADEHRTASSFGMSVIRACGWAIALLVTATACQPADDRDVVHRLKPAQVEVEWVAPSPRIENIPGLEIVDGERPNVWAEPLVDLADIRPGGLPPDGLPALNRPGFIRASSVWFMADREPVVALNINGDARAYPVQILLWHEIVNDVVGGVPVAITYCPLCNSAVAYERNIDDVVLEFGTSGRLLNSALVMYDRQTGSLWSHFTGDAVVGEMTGTDLVAHPLSTVAWSDWREANPSGLVLDRETGFHKEYGFNPYPGYDDVDAQPFLFDGEVDGRFTAMTRVVAFNGGDEAVAVPLSTLRDQRLVRIDGDDADVIVWWKPGTSSALDSFDVAAGHDVGSTFVGRVNGDDDFAVVNDGAALRDAATESIWNILGRATDGSRQGERIAQVQHFDTFWFAWAAYRPDTTVVRPG